MLISHRNRQFLVLSDESGRILSFSQAALRDLGLLTRGRAGREHARRAHFHLVHFRSGRCESKRERWVIFQEVSHTLDATLRGQISPLAPLKWCARSRLYGRRCLQLKIVCRFFRNSQNVGEFDQDYITNDCKCMFSLQMHVLEHV